MTNQELAHEVKSLLAIMKDIIGTIQTLNEAVNILSKKQDILQSIVCDMCPDGVKRN